MAENHHAIFAVVPTTSRGGDSPAYSEFVRRSIPTITAIPYATGEVLRIQRAFEILYSPERHRIVRVSRPAVGLPACHCCPIAKYHSPGCLWPTIFCRLVCSCSWDLWSSFFGFPVPYRPCSVERNEGLRWQLYCRPESPSTGVAVQLPPQRAAGLHWLGPGSRRRPFQFLDVSGSAFLLPFFVPRRAPVAPPFFPSRVAGAVNLQAALITMAFPPGGSSMTAVPAEPPPFPLGPT